MLGRRFTPALAAAVLELVSCCYYAGPAARSGGPERRHGAEPVVRVRLTAAGAPVRVACGRGMEVRAGRTSEQCLECRVEIGDGGRMTLRMGGLVVRTSDTVKCRPAGTGRLVVGERTYRGSVLVFPDGNDLIVVNELGLEEYLFGVVPCEIGPITGETFEAVKAQAVAARSFTLARLGRRGGPGFDLYDSYDRDQEYRGAGRETELARSAVEATRGEVLLYRGEVCEALYHACCGGMTGNGSQPFLRSIRDTPGHRSSGRAYCSSSRHFRWDAAVSNDSLERALGRQLGRERPGLRGVALEKDRQSGRVRAVRVSTRSGTLSLTGQALRSALGLKSTAFDVRKQGTHYVFSGRGWGHGSGMCQEGALAMARAGSTCRQILLHYYSGVEPGRAY